MRMFEIENTNLIYEKLHEIDLDIYLMFTNAINLLTMLTKQKSKNRNQVWKATLYAQVDEITIITITDWPDVEDPDIIDLIKKAKQMLVDTTELRNKLEF